MCPSGIYPRCHGEELRGRLARLKKLSAMPLQAKVDTSLRLIAEACERAKDAGGQQHVVMFSGGKDSSACALLAKRAGLAPLILVHCDTGMASPRTRDRVRRVADTLQLPLVICTAPEAPEQTWADHDCYPIGPKRGHTYWKRATPDARISPVQCCYHRKRRPAILALRQMPGGVATIAWGLRAADGDRRKLYVADHGIIRSPDAHWPAWSVSTVALWRDIDIARYLARELPGERHWEHLAEDGCVCCGVDLAHPDNQLTRLYLSDRERWLHYMRAGLGAQILIVQGRDPGTLGAVLAEDPVSLLRVMGRRGRGSAKIA